MRLLPLLLVSAMVAFAGCAKDDDGDDETPPTGNSTTTSTPAGTTAPTGTTPPTGPTKPAPADLCSKTFDFAQNAPAPPATTASKKESCGTAAAGYTKVVLNVTWTAGTPAPATLQQGVSVKLLGPDGTAAATCSAPAAGPQQTTPPPCAMEGTAAPGEYQLQYDGTGAIKATIMVQLS